MYRRFSRPGNEILKWFAMTILFTFCAHSLISNTCLPISARHYCFFPVITLMLFFHYCSVLYQQYGPLNWWRSAPSGDPHAAAGPVQVRVDAAARHRARRRERQKERRHQERDAEFGEFEPVQAPASGGEGGTPSRFQARTANELKRSGTRPSDQNPAKRSAASMRSTRGGFNKRTVRSISFNKY